MPSVERWIQRFNRKFEEAFIDKTIRKFQDGIGYSLIDEYPRSYRRQMGISDDVALKPFFKYYFKPEVNPIDDKYLPLTITVASTTEERDEDGHVQYLLIDNRVKRSKPIELSSSEDFYIDTSTGSMFERNKNKFTEIDLENIHTRIFNLHMSSWRKPKGFMTRMRLLLLRTIPSKVLKFLAFISGWIFAFIKQTRYRYDVIRERYLNSPQDSANIGTPSSNPPDGIDFFGYKVSIWTIFTYSVVVIIIYYYFGKDINQFMNKGESLSSIVTIAIAIVSIVIYDKILPSFLKKLIETMENVSYDISIKGIKLKV